MVSTIILTRFRDGPFPWDTGQRKILGGPLYPREELLAHIEEHGAEGINQWTQKCMGDIQALSLDKDDVLDLVRHALKTGTYIDSEWCERHVDGPWAACDAYRFTRREWFPRAFKHMDCDYFLKLAVSKTGALLLLISFHPSP
jgi:hypothetical protein